MIQIPESTPTAADDSSFWRWVSRWSPLFTLVSAACILIGGAAAWFGAFSAAKSAETAYKTASVAQDNAETSRAYARAQLYIMLKQRYYSVDRDLPKNYRASDYRPPLDSANEQVQSEWRAIRTYWYHCFDEWYATNKVSPEIAGDLWSTYYLPLHLSALQKPSLRGVFLDMCLNETREFGKGIRKEYADELKSEFTKKHGAGLGDLIAPATP